MKQYLLETSAVWLASLAVFDFFLQKENYHGYNRFYLLFTLLLGVLAPLIPALTSHSLPPATFASEGWVRWIQLCYIVGAGISCVLFLADAVKLYLIYHRGCKTKEDGRMIVETGRQHPPFSYFDMIFVGSRSEYSEGEWGMILAHEQRHSVLLHAVDAALVQTLRIVFWFNPLVYMFSRRLQMVHEYQADKASASQPQEYGRFLVEQAVLQSAPAISQPFNRSPIKNRILMLTKNASVRTGISNLKLLLVLPLTLLCVLFFAKRSYSVPPAGTVWKKQVARIVDLRESNDTVISSLRDVSPDKNLLEMIVADVRSGKLAAYSNVFDDFKTKVSKSDMDRLVNPKVDTLVQTDPKTGSVISRMTRPAFDYEKVHKYRVLEEWTHDPVTGKTEIEVRGIAPLEEIYGDDGSYRGTRALFYLRYRDVHPLVARYELYHPDNTLSSHIWDGYFSEGLVK